MKKIILIILLLVSLFLVSCEGEEKSVSKEIPPDLPIELLPPTEEETAIVGQAYYWKQLTMKDLKDGFKLDGNEWNYFQLPNDFEEVSMEQFFGEWHDDLFVVYHYDAGTWEAYFVGKYKDYNTFNSMKPNGKYYVYTSKSGFFKYVPGTYGIGVVDLKANNEGCVDNDECQSDHCTGLPLEGNNQKLCCQVNQCGFGPEDDYCANNGKLYDDNYYENGIGDRVCNDGVWEKTGCKDYSAHNFDPDVTVDDGSCETCFDELQNGDETDVDCGGSICDANCIDGSKCLVDADCQSNCQWSTTLGSLHEDKSYVIGVHEVEILEIQQTPFGPEVKFEVNEEVTLFMRIGDNEQLFDGTFIGVVDILYQDYAGGVKSVDFYINNQITTGTCAEVCSPGLTKCEDEDGSSACWDLENSVYNCGNCGTKCDLDTYEQCIDGFCSLGLEEADAPVLVGELCVDVPDPSCPVICNDGIDNNEDGISDEDECSEGCPKVFQCNEGNSVKILFSEEDNCENPTSSSFVPCGEAGCNEITGLCN